MVLYEAAVAIPVIAMLAMTAVTVFAWGMKTYFVQLADGELEQEVQMSFQRLMEEALTAETIEPMPRHEGYRFIKKNTPLKNQGVPGERFGTDYWLHNIHSLKKLVCGRDNFPMTGDHALASVTITEFSIVKDAGWPGIYRIRLTGKSEVTNHEYSLCSAVYIPQE